MGLFSKKSKERTWEDICSDLAKLLEKSRQSFFQATVDAVKAAGKTTPNDTLTGDGDLALKAYQMEVVSSFVGRQAYLAQEHLEEFDSLILQRIGGDDTDKCMEYVRRYYVETGEANVKLINDLIRFISGELEVDVSIVAGLRMRELIFSTDAQIVAAAAFGDTNLAGQLRSRAESAMANWRR
ncbi:MAG: hypothetical protein JSW50_11710 [Candidatus Latescibacterota bacterium]|nr:MAG: hypothetical protein JSW50_11710 [Candidatus Latescibacterota bacterium]